MSTPTPPPGPARPAATTAGPPPPRPPLRRRREGNLLAGVLAGVADHLGVDVAVVRILFVVLTILTQGAMLVAYLLGWVFIPEETEEEASAPRPARQHLGGRDPLFWVGVGTVIIGALWLLDGPFARGPLPFIGGRNVAVPLVLIAFGVALWRAGDRPPAAAVSATTMPLPPPEAVMSDQEHARDTGEEGGGGDDWSPPPVPRTGGVITRVTLGFAVLAVGALWWSDVAGLTVLGAGAILSAALVIVGLGLVVGSVRGRGRGLILPGLLLLPVVLALQVLQPPPIDVFGGGGTVAGQRIESPVEAADIRDSYQVGAGELRLDLSDVAFDDDRRVAIQVGAGEIWVRVPADVNVHATARVGAGEVDLLDQRGNGIGVDRSVVDVLDPDGPTLSIEAHVGFGQVRVVRTAPAQ